MGIGYVASAHNYYEGRLILAGEEAISPGTLVSADYAAGTAEIGVVSGKPVFFVAQENDAPIEYGINDVDQVIEAGKYLKLAPLVVGHDYKTTECADGLKAGDGAKFGSDKKFAKADGADFIVTQVDMVGDVPVYSLHYIGA